MYGWPFLLRDSERLCSLYFLYEVTLATARQSLTFSQNYTALLFSPGETNVCQPVISRNIWQQAVGDRKCNYQLQQKPQASEITFVTAATQTRSIMIWNIQLHCFCAICASFLQLQETEIHLKESSKLILNARTHRLGGLDGLTFIVGAEPEE